MCVLGEIPKFTLEGMTLQNKTARLKIVRLAVSKTVKQRKLLRRFPLNVRAVSAKIKLPKKYLQHCHILRTDKKNLSLLLLQADPARENWI